MLLLLPEPPVTAFMSVCLARDCNEWYYCLPLLLAAVCLMFRLRIFACCCLLVGNDERHGCTSYDRRTYVPSTKQKNTSTILFFAMFVLSFDQHELFNRKNENILLLFFCGRYSPNVRILAICYYPNPYSLFNFHFSAFGLIHFCCVEYCILFSVLLLLLVFVSLFRCVSVNVKSEIQFFRYYLSSFLLRQTESRAELLPQWLLYFFLWISSSLLHF